MAELYHIFAKVISWWETGGIGKVEGSSRA